MGSTPILSLVGVSIIVALVASAFRTDSTMQRASLAMIVGGAASNLLDRLGDGAVTDFLDFYIGAHHWPAFNVADIAIVCGAAALTALSIRSTASKTSQERA